MRNAAGIIGNEAGNRLCGESRDVKLLGRVKVQKGNSFISETMAAPFALFLPAALAFLPAYDRRPLIRLLLSLAYGTGF
jgi:hypothetical protein